MLVTWDILRALSLAQFLKHGVSIDSSLPVSFLRANGHITSVSPKTLPALRVYSECRENYRVKSGTLST